MSIPNLQRAEELLNLRTPLTTEVKIKTEEKSHDIASYTVLVT